MEAAFYCMCFYVCMRALSLPAYNDHEVIVLFY